ncbi:tetratricopeptide repeat protein [Streptomyces sp. NPDC056347]|uniref:tetratricopeptide repeat protein n=1 Tax=Streptomyces sp. NPDC056347 TaxID=3345790 RepID=UPI0035DC2991
MTRETGDPGPKPVGTALCVVCEEYEDGRFPRLPGAMAQMDRIVGLLAGLGYETRKVGGGNPSRAAFHTESDAWCEGWLATGAPGPALLVWSGHGELADEELRLVLSDLVLGDDPGMRQRRLRNDGVPVERLVNDATASGADQILLVVDTCHAGGAVAVSVEKVLRRWEAESPPPGHSKWLGIMASCQSNETSDGSGPLLEALTEVLESGPLSHEYRSAWSPHNALVRGTDLLDALNSRWRGEGQTPVPATAGTGQSVFPNPLHSPGAPAKLVEHLVLAARGVGHREEGWFFTGRKAVLGRIVDWMGTGGPGLFLVTGPAGCGKSAVLGRIATLTDPVQRAEAVAHGALRDGDPDPGVRADRAAVATVHLRGLGPVQVAEELARQLGLPTPRNADDFRAELRELSPGPTLVLDGLDEVPVDHIQSVIEELVFPISRSVPVLLGSRDRPFRGRIDENETLPAALARLIGAQVTTADLEREPHTRENIHEYVLRRCIAAGMPDGRAEETATAIAARATDIGGGFLFARLVTSSILARLGSGDRGGPRDLPESIEAAFEDDLRSGAVRKRPDGTEIPSAAKDLLTALAWTAGRGMPAGGVWEAVAGALGGGDTVYDESDVDWVLAEYGRYVVEDSENGQAVYRLYHREFVSHLMRREGPDGKDAGTAVLRTLVGLVRQQARVGDWSSVDPYARRKLVSHAVRVGAAGIEMLRGLADWDEEVALPYLAEAMHDFSAALSRSGEREAALSWSRGALSLYTELNETRAPGYLPDLAMSLNNLANHLADTGDRQGALTPAHEAVNLYRELAQQHPATFNPNLATSLNNLANHLATTGDHQAALQAYDTTIEAMADGHPSTVRLLTYERDRFLLRSPAQSTAAGVKGLVVLLSAPPTGSSDYVALRARHALRAHARESAENRDALATAWQAQTGEPAPAWLCLSPDTLDTVNAWLATPTWSDSRDHWLAHSDTLSSAEATTALAEFGLVSPDTAAQHEALRAEIIANGAPAAYAPLVLGEQLAAWVECVDWEQSAQFLQDRPELLGTDVPVDLPPVHAALLHAARTEDIAAAHRLVQDRAHLQEYVQRALTAGDAEALDAASAIEGEVFSDTLCSLTHAQAARILADAADGVDPGELAPLLVDASPDTRNRLVAEVATLSATHAHRHAALWVRIIQVLAGTATE